MPNHDQAVPSVDQTGLPLETMPSADTLALSDWTPTNSVDPDMNVNLLQNYHSDLSTSCNYYTDSQGSMALRNTGSVTFSVLHFNVRGITGNHRYNELEVFLASKNPTVVGLCETFLTESNYSLFNFTGFTEIHKPRSDGRGGGGVSLLIKEDLNYTTRPDLSNRFTYAESLFVELPRSNRHRKKIIVGEIYRVPSGNKQTFIEELESLLNDLKSDDCVCYLMGDINIDLMVCNTDPHALDYLSCLQRHMFYPLINRPTRLASRTLIDHIFTNSQSCLIGNKSTSGVILFDMSDHCPIFHTMDFDSHLPENNRPPDTLQCQLVNDHSIAQLKAILSTTDWSTLEELNEVDAYYEKFYEIFSDAYFRCIKTATREQKKNHKPWITSALKKSIKEKNRLYALLVKYPCQYSRDRYRSFKNRLNHLLRISERNYAKSQLDRYNCDIKRQWSMINCLLERGRHVPMPSSMRVQTSSEPLTSPEEISEKMNAFFINSGKMVLTNNPPHATDPLNSLADVSHRHSMFARIATKDEILKIMEHLKDSSAGIDKLKPKVVKHVRNEIAIPVTKLVNLSLKKGIFPSKLKEAIVTPIHKKDAKDVISNYRPISVLCVFAKIIEKVAHERLSTYFEKLDLIYPRQFGFRTNHSTEQAVTEVTNKIYRALNDKKCTVAVSMDLSKAFDTINHNILLMKLQKYGVNSNILHWIQSYLANRVQRVKYMNVLSPPLYVQQGVPQGSNLGPLLFIIYINDLPNVCKDSDTVLYADDCSILTTFDRSDVSVVARTNARLALLADWFASNRLALNISKTSYMVFSGRKRLSLDGVSINNITLQQVSSSNFLGIIIDDTLSWKNHLSVLRGKLSRSIGVLRKVSKHLSRSIMVQLYNTFFMPYLQYGITIWGAAPTTTLNPIYILQKKALKTALHLPIRTPTELVFRESKTLSLHNVYRYRVAIFMHKLRHHKIPSLFQSYFSTNAQVHNRSTRSSNLFRLPLFTTVNCQQSILFQGPKIWSSLSNQIRNCVSFPSFKKQMRIYLSDRPNTQ